jgi:hypothetical protein
MIKKLKKANYYKEKVNKKDILRTQLIFNISSQEDHFLSLFA